MPRYEVWRLVACYANRRTEADRVPKARDEHIDLISDLEYRWYR